jgi:hypothetical protein
MVGAIFSLEDTAHAPISDHHPRRARQPRHILGFYNASRAHFSTDPRRAIKFEDLGSACVTLGHLRISHLAQAEWISVRSEPRVQARPKSLAWGWFAAGLFLAGLAGCSHAPRSASDCGRHFVSGSGLLGLAGAMGAFDRAAGPDCQSPVYQVTSEVAPAPVWVPADPDPLPLPETPPSLFIPGGSGTLVGVGGSGAGQLMVPAGSGTYMAMP